MTELLLGIGIAAATGYGLFERWRRLNDKSVAALNHQQAESLREAAASDALTASHAQHAAEAASRASQLLDSQIAESQRASKVYAETAISARLAAEAILLSMRQTTDGFESWARHAADEREAWTERRKAEAASSLAAMQALRDATVAAESSSVAASKAAAAVTEAAELYCEQLNIPRRSDAAQRRRWEAFTSAIKDGADPMDALKGVS